MDQSPYSVDCGDGKTNCGIISGCLNSFYMSDEDPWIMRWRSPLEPNIRHKGVGTDKFDGIGS